MFSDLLLNPRTESKLNNYLAAPGHGLLLVGPVGSGKVALARALTAKLLGVSPDKLDNQAYFLHISRQEKKQDITIEAIRNLISTLKLTVPGRNRVRRVVLIEDAHLMSREAQNAFLKSLEEPAPGTVFILTTPSKTSLLPTVVSRTTPVSVEPIAQEQAYKFFSNYSQAEVAAAWALSQGAAGLLASLLQDESSELKQAVEQAKDLLGKDRYSRLIELDKLSANKPALATLLSAMTRVYKALYRAAAAKNDPKRMNAAIAATKVVLEAQTNLQLNIMPRLVILKLVLKLPL